MTDMSEFAGHLAPAPESRSVPRPASMPERGFDLEQQLREGKYYTNIKLEGYMAENPWPREIVARDILQNFFDANGFTLDGIEIDIQEEGDKTTVTVRGDQSYPYQRLVSFGSGQKDDPRRSAGGKHQGTKDVVVMLLREYGCQGVQFGSDEWALTFYKDALPTTLQEKDKEEKEHGVFLHLEDCEKEKGNFLRFETNDRDMAEALIKAREFFYHDSNSDFHHPDFSSEQGGMRILAHGQKGNFYLNGQRISFEERRTWETVPGFTLWSKETPEFGERKIELNRDRDIVSAANVEQIFVPFLVESMSPEEHELILFGLDAYFSTDQFWEPTNRIGQRFIKEIVQRLQEAGKQISFAPTDIADDLDYESSMRGALKDQGYRLCLSELGEIGMPLASQILKRLELQYETEPTEAEGKRIEILREVVRPFLRGSERRLKITDKEVKLFTAQHPALEAQYAGDFVWMERRVLLRERPHETLATYFHELCHEFGSDESASFSYKLTDLLAEWTQYLADHPEALHELERLWKENPTEPLPVSLEDLLSQARPLIEKDRSGLRRRYTPEQLEARDKNLNVTAELLLDIIVDDYDGVVSADTIFKIRQAILNDPVAQRTQKMEASWSLSAQQKSEIEAQKQQISAVLTRLWHEQGVLGEKKRQLDSGKTVHKRGRMQLKKEYDQQLARKVQEIQEAQDEQERLREQLPESWQWVRPTDRVKVGGKSFEPLQILDPTFFYLAGLRVLHAQFPIEHDRASAEKMQSELKRVLDQMFEETVHDNLFPTFVEHALTIELDLHLGFTKKVPTESNLALGFLLIDAILARQQIS